MAMAAEMPGQRSETVRRANLSAIVRELHLHGPLSRSVLVARTGLTRGGIRAPIADLVAGKLVSEERSAPLGALGRPSVRVCPSPEGAVVLALEIAVDSLAVAVVGLGGEVQYQARVDRPRGRFSAAETVADLAAMSRPSLRQAPARDRLIGVGVAVVGMVRRADGLVALAPNLGWRDVALGGEIAAAVGADVPVSVANEADLGALAESRRGAATGYRDVIFISGEVGVGGGLIIDGRPHTGSAGFGGEVGHMPVNPNGSTCRCGAVGCWETEIGERALLLRAGHPADGGREEVEAVIREAVAGDAAALSALDTVGRWLGFGLAGLTNILNPQLIVLGGLPGRLLPLIAPSVRDEFESHALPASRASVEIVPATLGVDAPLLGAAELAFEPLLDDPASWVGPRTPGVAAGARSQQKGLDGRRH